MPNESRSIRAIITEAQNQIAFAAHTPPGFVEPTAYISKPAALHAVLGLNAQHLPELIKNSDSFSFTAHAPLAAPGSASMPLAAAIAASSRVAQAGAHLIVRPEQDKAFATGSTGIVALQRVIDRFDVIDAAPFETAQPDPVAPDDYADLSASPLPVKGAVLDWAQSIAKGWRFEITRAAQKEIGEEFLAGQIIFAAVLGLARAADAVLLSAINATAPAPFSLGAAAARGLKFDELRALAGTAGAGATVGQDGELRTAGVAAELTPDMAETLIGSFARSAVAVHEEVQLHFERRNTRGDLMATVWAQFIPLVPDSNAFWTVA